MGARPEGPMGGGAGRRGGGRGMRRGGGRGMRGRGPAAGVTPGGFPAPGATQAPEAAPAPEAPGQAPAGRNPLTPEQRQARRERRISRLTQRADDFAARSERASARATKTEENIEANKGRYGTSGLYGGFGPVIGAGRIDLQRERAERLRGKADKMRARAERIRSRSTAPQTGEPTPQPAPVPEPVADQVSGPIDYAPNNVPVVRSNDDVVGALPTNFSSYPVGGSGIENVSNAAPERSRRIRRARQGGGRGAPNFVGGPPAHGGRPAPGGGAGRGMGGMRRGGGGRRFR